MSRVPIAAGVVALAFITFFQFPGHTWLQQDSQIYAPILEHLEDSSALHNDVLVQRPHVSFTLYDEIALGLRRLTGLGFRELLGAEQLLFRALGIWGIFLMATATGLGSLPAFLVAGIVSLGAMAIGPQVLTFEYEPIPRGFAVPLLLCAVGLAAHGRYVGAGVAATVSFLVHPPTVYPFWGLYFLLALRPTDPEVMKRRIYGLLCLLAGAVVLLVAARYQAGAGESQVFFSRLTPLQIQLQHWRSAYLWVSVWGGPLAVHYLLICTLLGLSYWRIRQLLPSTLLFFVAGLPVVGLLSLPVSYLLLERARWALLPQFQPMRALLFVVLMLQFSAAVAAVWAAVKRRYVEAFGFFAAAYALPLLPRLDAIPDWRSAATLLLLAGMATIAMRLAARKGAWAGALCATVLAGFWIAPVIGRVVNYPHLHSPELAQLSLWAKQSTPRDSVFLFADVPRSMETGIFRAEAYRAIYVDWKGGGQVNYLKELGEQWWFRWQQTLGLGFHPGDMQKYDALGIHYVVLQPRSRLAGRTPLFENARYLAYPTRLPPQ